MPGAKRLPSSFIQATTMRSRAGVSPRSASDDDRFERRQHARGAVELAAGRLAVEMAAEQNGRRRAIAAGKDEKQVAGRIGRSRQAGILRPADHATPGFDLAVAERLAVDAAGRRGADLGERHQPRPQTIGVDQRPTHRVTSCA